jgi:hypothetical protein
MKEQAQASTICRYLDQSAEHLPYRVVERLAAARARAVARLADPVPAEAAAPLAAPPASPPAAPHLVGSVASPAQHPAFLSGAVSDASSPGLPASDIHIPAPHAPGTRRPAAPAREIKPLREGRTPFWWRLAATAVPLVMLAVGIVVVDTVHQEQSAAELAEVDSALLTDDVPLVAYADRGFGVYIRNTRR